MRRTALAAMLVIGVLAMVGCGGNGDVAPAVATVNGEEITEQELDVQLNQYRQQYASQGMDLDAEPDLLAEVQSDVLNEMIDQKLLLEYAADEGLTASQEAMDAEYQALLQQVGGEETLQELLDAQGMSRDELMGLIEDEVMLKYLQDYVREERGLEVTEVALEDAYEQYREMMPDIPPLDEIRPQLRAELEHQQYMEVLPTLLETLREDAEIEVYL